MSSAKFGSRRLMVILAFLLINSHSITYSKLPLTPEAVSSTNTAAPNALENSEVVMLVDSTSGQCLGTHGDFGECGELSLWLWDPHGSKGKLQSITAIDEEEGSVPSVSGECLGRKRSALGKAELKMVPCTGSALAPTQWTYDEKSGKLADAGLTSKFIGPSCVTNGINVLQSCKNGFTALRKVLFHSNAHNAASGLASAAGLTSSLSNTAGESAFSDMGTWKCPVTGQVFPRNLDQHLSAKRPLTTTVSTGAAQATATSTLAATRGGSSTASVAAMQKGGRQVFMGAGVFSKVFMGMTFNVYSMGWYVEADAAQRDPSLRAYRDKPLSELQSTEAFYQQLSSGGSYDRTLFVKLAMTLKTKMLLEGFLSEIVLQPQNKAAVARASAAYTVPVCPEGLEIIFTWRVPKTTAGTSSSTGASAASAGGASGASRSGEYLEVRIGDMYFELHEPGLAEDFMRQFFAPENPVSPSAKKGFTTFFPVLLQGQKSASAAAQSKVPASGSAVGSVGTGSAAEVVKEASRAPAGIFGLRGWKVAA